MSKTTVIPDQLKRLDQWCTWRYRKVGNKQTKVPVRSDGAPIDTTDRSTWQSYAEVADHARIGFVFSEDDPYFGLDLDDCIIEGALSPYASDLVIAFGTYTEVSPSGTGLKLIGIGNKPGPRCKSTNVEGMGAIEIYDRHRFFTVTGKVVSDEHDILDCQEDLDALYAEVFPDSPRKAAGAPCKASTMSDEEVLDRIAKSRQAASFASLWQGNTAAYNGDHSAADLALLNVLIFWTQDLTQVDRLFRQSGLMRDKWDSRRGDTTYGELSMRRVLDTITDTYKPREWIDWPSSRQVVESFEDRTTPTVDDSSFNSFEQYVDGTLTGQRRAVPFVFDDIGKLTRALVPRTTTILCGNPGSTKSFLLIQAMRRWYDEQVPAAVLMLEDEAGYHLNRAFAQVARDARLLDTTWVENNPDDVVRLRLEHESYLRGLSTYLDTPPLNARLTHDLILGWIKAKAQDGARVIAVDPISIAANQNNQHLADVEFMEKAKSIVGDYDTSLILVTHPKKHPDKIELDSVSGGASYTRFAHCVLWLNKERRPEQVRVADHVTRLPVLEEINRRLYVLKARNGQADFAVYGLQFNHRSVCFEDAGLILDTGGN